MIKYKTIKMLKEINTPDSIVCDVCKKEFPYTNSEMETQEFTMIHYRGGYGSIFGDGNEVELHMCQNCLKEKLGEYVRINEL